MNFNEKKEFLEYCKELAINLENKTDEFIEVQIGWIDAGSVGAITITIMLNHKSCWFGDFEKDGWNENVVWNSINKFEPVKNPYLALNELINKAYRK